MTRKGFFGNLLGFIGVAASAKELAKVSKVADEQDALGEVIELTSQPKSISEINRKYFSAVDPLLDTREINPMWSERIASSSYCKAFPQLEIDND